MFIFGCSWCLRFRNLESLEQGFSRLSGGGLSVREFSYLVKKSDSESVVIMCRFFKREFVSLLLN